jgi:hypothetical protein
MGLMLKVLKQLGKKPWTKKSARIVTMQGLELEVGNAGGDLVSTDIAVLNLIADSNMRRYMSGI